MSQVGLRVIAVVGLILCFVIGSLSGPEGGQRDSSTPFGGHLPSLGGARQSCGEVSTTEKKRRALTLRVSRRGRTSNCIDAN